MEYLTVGRSEIKKDSFGTIKNGENGVYKPTGGIWFTKYDSRYPGYNDWVEYLVNNPDVLYYKNLKRDLWHHPCSVVGLTMDANIFYLNNFEKYNYLINAFALDNGRFSYEKISEIYDGIFVDTKKLIGIGNEHITKLVMQYAVDTLLLFNIKPIDYYYSGIVTIEPFDLEYYMYNENGYQITCDKLKKRVK